MKIFHGTIFFTTCFVSGTWITNYAQNPYLVYDVNKYPLAVNPVYEAITLDSVVYFIAFTNTYGNELWRSDGTESGTYMLKDIFPGSPSGGGEMIESNGKIFFRGNNGISNGIWVSDGTAAGTVPFVNIIPYDWLGAVNGLIFFTYNDTVHGQEIWIVDEITAATSLLKDINPGTGPGGSLAKAVVTGDALFFSANNGVNGMELWKTDGTEANTFMVKDINPGINSSNIDHLVSFNGDAYFEAEDGVHGKEFWKSDGTYSGTYQEWIFMKEVSVPLQKYTLLKISSS